MLACASHEAGSKHIEGTMKDGNNPSQFDLNTSTRRQLITWSAMALGGVIMAGARSGTRSSQAAGTPAKPVSADFSPIHQEVDFEANPQSIYNALLDSKQFAAFTGAPADIHSEVGGAFSCFNGVISGRNIELVPNHRIVQAWRVSGWPAGVYSVVKFELKAQGSGTKIILDHSGFPEGTREHLDAGWKPRYWTPLQKYLATQGKPS
jgi:activator of HSP90 ATPase